MPHIFRIWMDRLLVKFISSFCSRMIPSATCAICAGYGSPAFESPVTRATAFFALIRWASFKEKTPIFVLEHFFQDR